MEDHSEKTAICESGRGPSFDTKSADTLILDFSSSMIFRYSSLSRHGAHKPRKGSPETPCGSWTRLQFGQQLPLTPQSRRTPLPWPKRGQRKLMVGKTQTQPVCCAYVARPRVQGGTERGEAQETKTNWWVTNTHHRRPLCTELWPSESICWSPNPLHVIVFFNWGIVDVQ